MQPSACQPAACPPAPPLHQRGVTTSLPSPSQLPTPPPHHRPSPLHHQLLLVPPPTPPLTTTSPSPSPPPIPPTYNHLPLLLLPPTPPMALPCHPPFLQVMCNLLSLGNEEDPEVMSMNGAAAALVMSSIPWGGPMGAARVCLVGDSLIANPPGGVVSSAHSK